MAFSDLDHTVSRLLALPEGVKRERLGIVSSVRALYPRSYCLFHGGRHGHGWRFRVAIRGSCFRSQGKQIVDRVPEILLASEVAFRCLHRSVSQQELNLLDLSAAGMAQLRARPAQVVGRDVL